MVNMVASADGATAVGGVSDALGGEGDSLVFRAIRAVPDAILVAAGTARAENYGPPAIRPDVVGRREAAGQSPTPTLVVVTGSGNLDVGGRLFEGGHRPLVYTSAAAEPERIAQLRNHTEVIEAGDQRVDLHVMLADLYARDVRVVLLEGGPSLNGEMASLGLIDEWCLSLAPKIAGGESKRIAAGPTIVPPTDLDLDRILEHDGELFLRYVSRPPGTE